MTLLTSRQIGDFAGVPERTVRDWQLKGIVPETEEMAVAVRAIVLHFKAEGRRKTEDLTEDPLNNEKIRLTRLQADKLFLEIQVREGELVNANEAQKEWSKMVAAFRARLLSLPHKAASQVVEITEATLVELLLKDYVYEALEELSQYTPEN